MPVNIYDTPADAQFINTYERMPVDQIMQAGLAMQDRWDRGEALRDDLIDSLNVDALQHRTPQKQEAVGKITDQINQIIEDTGSEYHKALPKLENLHRKVQKELTEGELGGLQAEYNQRVAYEELLDKMIEDEDMTHKYKEKLLTEADRRSQLTSRLGQNQYGAWTKDQWAGLTPVEYQELGDAFSAILKDMPDLTVETLGQWLTDDQSREHRNRVLPPGMYEAINTTIKNKGAAAGLQETLQIIAMTDPKYRDFIAQNVELEMGQLEAQETAVPGTKNRLLENSEVDLDLMRQLEEAGIDIYSQEGQDIILRKTLERDLTESILSGPISTAIARQGGSSLTMDRDKHTPPEHASNGNKGGDDDGYGTVVEQGATMAFSPSSLGDNKEEIEETIAERKKEIAKLPANEQLAAEEQLQKEINISNRKRDSLPEDVKKVLDDKPVAPEFLNDAQKEFANKISSNDMLSTNSVRDWMIPDEIQVPGTDVIVYPEKWMFKRLAEEIVDDPEYYNKTPEAVKQVTKEFTGSGLISSIMSGMADFADIGEEGIWPGMPATGEERDKRVAEVLKYHF